MMTKASVGLILTAILTVCARTHCVTRWALVRSLQEAEARDVSSVSRHAHICCARYGGGSLPLWDPGQRLGPATLKHT